MRQNIIFYLSRLSDKLYFKPLVFCLFSIGGALIAHLADDTFLTDIVPDIQKDSLDDLLSTLANSMLVIAIFAVGSMLSAFAAASATATPRSFKLVVADDVSQNALSIYIGSFIFSIVASVAFKNGYYGKAGYFVLFVLTLTVFLLVIVTFLRWVQRISKLGRLGYTIKKIEDVTAKIFEKRIKAPRLGGSPIIDRVDKGIPLYSEEIGYIQYVNMENLQVWAEQLKVIVTLTCMPGSFISPDKTLAFIVSGKKDISFKEKEKLSKAFIIGRNRSFYNDPRFGLIALSEIASRALSPGINDPGTAVAIINSYVRLFALWFKKDISGNIPKVKYTRIEVPDIQPADLFEDAFRPIARDGASNIEVMIRMQKAFTSIYSFTSDEVKEITLMNARHAFERAEIAIDYKVDLDDLKKERLHFKS
ncbi:MAG: DUF2254 domain-containing protein [Dysgonamonadaceae bacterium]|nr:DUF2254 domain-containing protein [Dysgonamonadaceae bacterium]MDD4728300.1 DUF2254 domain-containing protein [Dysgonamonadaceae bacterium]